MTLTTEEIEMDTGYNANMSYGKMQELKRVIREVLNEELGGNTASAAPTAKLEPITEPEQRILDAMHWLEVNTGKGAFMASIVAYFSRYLPVSPGFMNMRKRLRKSGYIDQNQTGYMLLTAAGREASKPVNHIAKEEGKTEAETA